MKTKREIEIVLLTFAVTTIVWCFTWAYVVDTITKSYEDKIELLTK
jgi:ATP/ADP translocase